MKKLLVPLLFLLVGAGGCIIEEEGRPRHVHCYGCGHVYVHGQWR
jgi:hypothetical protein